MASGSMGIGAQGSNVIIIPGFRGIGITRAIGCMVFGVRLFANNIPGLMVIIIIRDAGIQVNGNVFRAVKSGFGDIGVIVVDG